MVVGCTNRERRFDLLYIIFYGFDPRCPFSESTFVWEKLSLSAAQGIGSIPNPESVPPLLPPSDIDCGGE